MKEVNDAFSRSHKVVVLEQIYGKVVRNYPDWWLNDRYEDFMHYGCTPSQYKQLIKTRA